MTMVLEGFKDLTRGLSEVSTDDDVEDISFGLAMALILDEILQYLTKVQIFKIKTVIWNFKVLNF